jgi:Ricin-type beta-trefoil lectin domain-like
LHARPDAGDVYGRPELEPWALDGRRNFGRLERHSCLPPNTFQMKDSIHNNFELVNVNSGKCLEVQGGGRGNNVNIVQSQCNGGRNQRWYAGYALPGGPSPR